MTNPGYQSRRLRGFRQDPINAAHPVVPLRWICGLERVVLPLALPHPTEQQVEGLRLLTPVELLDEAPRCPERLAFGEHSLRHAVTVVPDDRAGSSTKSAGSGPTRSAGPTYLGGVSGPFDYDSDKDPLGYMTSGTRSPYLVESSIDMRRRFFLRGRSAPHLWQRVLVRLMLAVAVLVLLGGVLAGAVTLIRVLSL